MIYSTDAADITVLDHITKSLDHDLLIILVMLDILGAIDTLDY